MIFGLPINVTVVVREQQDKGELVHSCCQLVKYPYCRFVSMYRASSSDKESLNDARMDGRNEEEPRIVT